MKDSDFFIMPIKIVMSGKENLLLLQQMYYRKLRGLFFCHGNHFIHFRFREGYIEKCVSSKKKNNMTLLLLF